MREADEQYFQRLESELDEAFEVARSARERGGDPTTDVEIPVAKDMADRVENILGIDGVAERVRELEGEMSREEAALALVSDFVDGEVGDYDTKAGKIEGAVRTAVALLTEGVVAAPIEGIDRVEVLPNDDGTEFVNVYYAGPIRSAGGTAQALSVLVADYARTLLGIDEYHAREEEIGRYVEEIELYDEDTGLQYSPKDKETRHIAENMPIMLDGEATGDEEVSGYRDLERVDSNSARGGMCLVLAEGIALKAPKIQRYTRSLEDVEWPWLQDLIDGTIGHDDEEADAGDSESDTAAETKGVEEDEKPDGPPRVDPTKKYLRDLIAGRPVFSHPSESGGFRLRYGRARNHGFATAGVHPATMHLVDDFLATGTQIKTERPGKAAGVVPVDTIEGPTVRLANGDVRRIDDPEEALEIRNGVEKVLDLGEYLVNYGEFVENNHPLAPASYTVEWWRQEFAEGGADVQAMADSVQIDLADPDPAQALAWARQYDAPLHPKYTYLYHDVSVRAIATLATAIDDADVVASDGSTAEGTNVAEETVDDTHDSTTLDGGNGDLILERTETVQTVLETLLVEHTQTEASLIVPTWRPLVETLGFDDSFQRSWTLEDLSAEARSYADGENAIRAVNEIAPFDVRERAPTRIGNRMGRPEKSEERELSPAVHTLFPIGEAGGNQRDVAKAAGHADSMNDTPGEVALEVGRRRCVDCGTETYRPRCPDCGGVTESVYVCPDCDREVDPDESGRAECPRCETLASPTQLTTIDVGEVYRQAKSAVGEREVAFDVLKGVKGLSSKEKTPEPMEKGVLRAKHDVSAFKDGTIRYDMTDLPVTSVRPAELDVTVEQFRELGYETDIHGDPLTHDDQLVELKVQDVVLSDGAAEHMLKTADFIDDLLTSYYGLERYYDLEDREDLVGELVFGMAPHTSAATVGRVIGFTSAAVGYAHPYFHAAKRRNCFHPDTDVWYEAESGEWHHRTIEEFVEARLEDPRTDDFGTLIEDLDGEVRVPSIDTEGEPNRKPVEAVSKHPAPDHLIEIETKSGRSLTISPGHSMRRWTNGLEDVPASELEAGDQLPMPKSITGEWSNETIDLLVEFSESDRIPNDALMIRGLGSERIKSLFAEATSSEQYLVPVADRLDKTKSTVYNWVNRDSVPFSVFKSLFDDAPARIPDDVQLGIKRDTAAVSRNLDIDESFATLLGYYVAEGFTRSSDQWYQTTICIPDGKARTLISRVFDDALSVEAYPENEWKMTVSSRLVVVLFEDILELGHSAETKQIPDAMLTAPEPILRAFLAAYFSGDGSASTDRIEVRANTVSDPLKDTLIAGLKRFGVVPKIYREERTPTSGALKEFYDEPKAFESWILKITSENAARFAERVGFHLPRKQDTLETALDSIELRPQRLCGDGGDVWLDTVESVEIVESEVDYLYSLTVQDTHTLVANDIYTGQCDGDEDCVMLLMDGLLNFSRKYLPDQRGGSVAADSRLLAFDPDGTPVFLTFSEFWDRLDADVVTDGKFRKKTCRTEGWTTYAFDENHEASLQPIEKAIRYRADEDATLVRIETQFGRSLSVTDHHSLFRYDDGIEEVAGGELQNGDLVVSPRELAVEAERTTIDVADRIDDPYVVIDDHVEDLLRTAWDSTERDSPTHQAFDQGLSYRLSKSKIPFERFETILNRAGFEVPRDVQIALQGSETGIRRHIDVDADFAWLLGLFVAEGTTSSVSPCVHNADEKLIDRAAAIATAAFGVEPGRRWSNRAYELRFPAVFREVLYSLGFVDADSYDSSEKVVPECILTAPREIVLDFLRGFVAGDGSDSSDDNVTTVSFHSTSSDVKDAIVFLLHRLGLVANVSEQTDRPGNRQDIFTVTVSGGANDNPLHRILDGEDSYHPKSLVVSIPDALMDLREMNIEGVKQTIPKYLKRRENVSLEKLEEMIDEIDGQQLPAEADEKLDEIRPLVDGDLSYLRVTNVKRVDYDGYLYDLQVGGQPVFTANWLYAHNSMDAPLVMSSRIDPAEIDDEAHNMDIVDQYPLELYEATRELAHPEDVDVQIAEDTLGTDSQYTGFQHTHDTTNIAAGPDLSAYKTLGSMQEKMDAQLELSRKLRAVDETDVAERIIEYHFLPDLIGNLRAFSRQDVRCLDCGEKYRRAPLTGDCPECGGDINLTVHEGSVNKYIDTATRVAEEFGAREYTKQRLEILERSIERVFEDDTSKQTGIADFM